MHPDMRPDRISQSSAKQHELYDYVNINDKLKMYHLHSENKLNSNNYCWDYSFHIHSCNQSAWLRKLVRVQLRETYIKFHNLNQVAA